MFILKALSSSSCFHPFFLVLRPSYKMFTNERWKVYIISNNRLLSCIADIPISTKDVVTTCEQCRVLVIFLTSIFQVEKTSLGRTDKLCQFMKKEMIQISTNFGTSSGNTSLVWLIAFVFQEFKPPTPGEQMQSRFTMPEQFAR